ncbi:MAG: polyamine ABC transporter substrate-binding protein [Rhodospirillales bacterium]|nr:polyamine ABC transporter substrate-binding protein [Rhodospirillales bacterium]
MSESETVMRRLIALIIFSAAAVISGAAGAAEGKVLNVYNWSDYIAKDTLSRFTAETGIKVNYDVYDSNEVLEAKLMAGSSGYDVVFPSASPFVARQVKSGIYRNLDRSKLPNWHNLTPSILKALTASDPGNVHAVPYMVAGTGVGYNIAKVQAVAPGAPTESWAMIFDPAWARKLSSCGISLLDDPNEVFAAAYAYLGIDTATERREDLEKAVALIQKIRPLVKYFHSSSYINDLANGDTCVSHGYGGDLIQSRDRAAEAKRGVAIRVFLPKEGAQAVIDVMAIPADAKHPENAHTFINFMMRPDVVGPITNLVGYANAVIGAEKFVDEARLKDPVVYPSQEVRDRFFVIPLKSSAYDRLQTRTWTRIKTGQ